MKNNGNERWSQVTAAELDAVKKEKCVNCPYCKTFSQGKASNKATFSRYFANYADQIYCNYLLITGHVRETDVFDCEHYKDDKTEVKRLERKALY